MGTRKKYAYTTIIILLAMTIGAKPAILEFLLPQIVATVEKCLFSD